MSYGPRRVPMASGICAAGRIPRFHPWTYRTRVLMSDLSLMMVRADTLCRPGARHTWSGERQYADADSESRAHRLQRRGPDGDGGVVRRTPGHARGAPLA